MIEKIPYRSGRCINGKIEEIEPIVSSKKAIMIPTPTTSDQAAGHALGRCRFRVKPNGQVLKINPNGQGWSLSLSHWLRFNPTPIHKPNAEAGDFVKPLSYGRINPDWCEWLMGFERGWTEL